MDVNSELARATFEALQACRRDTLVAEPVVKPDVLFGRVAKSVVLGVARNQASSGLVGYTSYRLQPLLLDDSDVLKMFAPEAEIAEIICAVCDAA